MKNFIRLLEQSVKESYDSIEIIDYPGEAISYGQLFQHIKKLHSKWKGMGLREGDKIAIYASNSIKWLELYLAIITGGYVAVLLSKNYLVEQIKELYYHSDSKILYTDEINILENECGINCQNINFLDVHFEHNYSPRGTHYSYFEDAPCTIIYTSGSSGCPKGCVLTGKCIDYYVDIIRIWMFRYQSGNTHINFLPFTHIFGIICDIIAPISMGLNIIVNRKVLTAPNICHLMSLYKPSIFLTTPPILESIIHF